MYETPVAHDRPVRSPEIVNVSELRLAPLVLGGALLASLALGLWLAVTLSVRDRRRELAVLRALGFAGRDVRGSVHWQGMTLVAVGVVLGIPLGVVGGRGRVALLRRPPRRHPAHQRPPHLARPSRSP